MKSLLLHACCAPCASACIEQLHALGNYKICIFFYNPNITDEQEYLHRLDDVIKLCKLYNVPVVSSKYDPESFSKISKGHESDPECGARCKMCYAIRINKCAEVAKTHHFDMFATTLTLSPFKDHEVLNRIGTAAGEHWQIDYLPTNFKENGGYKKSIELSDRYDLYRQNYCGCEFSKSYEDLESSIT